MRLLQQKGWSFFLRRTWDPWFCSHLFFKVMQMKHEPHGDFYIIVCYYCCSPCNWNFLHSFVCSYTVLWTKGIYKTPNIFFSLPGRVQCRVLQMDTLLSHKRLSLAHAFFVRDNELLTLQPSKGEGRSCWTCVAEGNSFYPMPVEPMKDIFCLKEQLWILMISMFLYPRICVWET